ncbi:MAG: hydrogenase expression/formation protein HypE [Candidatus Nanohalobium sp.]
MTERKVSRAHGGGGRQMDKLIQEMLEEFPDAGGKASLKDFDDGSTLKNSKKHVVTSTDSHVAKPVFFPGGNLGKLAVTGTVNDIAMMGAEPEAITLSIIVEEGLPIENLEKIFNSIKKTCKEAETPVISGDTKIMPKGEIDGIAINTTGIGFTDKVIKDSGLQPGDKIIINGGIAEHGVTMMSARDEYSFQTDLKSDLKPLNNLVNRLRQAGKIKALKDPTRGGLAAALNELAESSGAGIKIDKEKVPVKDAVEGACEMLGLDPFNIANEGKLVAGVEEQEADKVLEQMKASGFENSAIIGQVNETGKVSLETGIGGHKILPRPEGGNLPRIC